MIKNRAPVPIVNTADIELLSAMILKMKMLLFVAFLLPFIGFGQTDTTIKKHNSTRFINRVNIETGIGVPNVQLYKDNSGDVSSHMYSFKAFLNLKPTVQIGIGTQFMQWDYQKESTDPRKQTAQLFFLEINRVYSLKKINVNGGIFAGIGTVKETYRHDASIFVAGFDMGVEYKIITHIGVKAEIAGLTGMNNDANGNVIWPALLSLVVHL